MISLFLCALPLDVEFALALTVLDTEIFHVRHGTPSRGWHLALREAATGAVVKHSIGFGVATPNHSGQALAGELTLARFVVKYFAARIFVAISLVLALAGTSLVV